MEKLADGQFNESDLTFKDLAIIEETVSKNLMGIHQRRNIKNS